MAEHVLELLQLVVGDDGDGLVEAARFDAAVDHEAVDVGELHDLAALAVAAADEDDAGDHDAFDTTAAPIIPYPDLLLRGHIAFYPERTELLRRRLLVPAVDHPNVPVAGLHAYGAVNARGHCRNLLRFHRFTHKELKNPYEYLLVRDTILMQIYDLF